MDSKFEQLLSGKPGKGPAMLKEYASLIGNQYKTDPSEANKMWDMLIVALGEASYYASILRMRNEIAHVIGGTAADHLLSSDLDRVKKWLSVTKGSKAYKIFSLCPMFILEGNTERAIQLIRLLDDGNAYYENVQQFFYYLQREVIYREYNEKNPNSDAPYPFESTLDRGQVKYFTKIYCEHTDDPKLKEIANTWYCTSMEEPMNRSSEAEKNKETKVYSCQEKINLSDEIFTFPEVDPDLASMVLSVANDIDLESSNGLVKRISFNITTNIDLSPFLRNIYRQHFPELSDDIIEQLVAESEEKRKKEAELEKLKQEETQALIKARLNGDAALGWALAYQLCGEIDNRTTRQIRYQVCNKLSDISLGQKIEIYEKYIEDITPAPDGKMLLRAKVYREIIEMILLSKDSSYYEFIDKYYDLACAYTESQSQLLMDLIDFCRKNGLSEEAKKWNEKLFGNNFANADSKIEARYLLKSGIPYDTPEQFELLIHRLDYSSTGITELIDNLIRKKHFDYAEKLLDCFESAVKKKADPMSDHPYWIQSIRYRMKYYRKGLFFRSYWNPIRFHDSLKSREVPYVNRIKSKYAKEFEQHRYYLTDYELIQTLPSVLKKDVYPEYIETCKKEILVVPGLLAFIDNFRKYAKRNKDKVAQIYNTEEILTQDKYKLLNCSAFKDLAIYYEREKQFTEAIKVCDMAIDCGFEHDGTKGGIRGRREKLLKKVQ